MTVEVKDGNKPAEGYVIGEEFNYYSDKNTEVNVVDDIDQGTKCEEWKDEKKSSATVLYTQNYKLAACVHCTWYTLWFSSSIDQSHFYRCWLVEWCLACYLCVASSGIIELKNIMETSWGNRESLENCRVLYENAVCTLYSVSWKITELFGTNKSERKVIDFLSQSFLFSERNRILMTCCDFPRLLNN